MVHNFMTAADNIPVIIPSFSRASSQELLLTPLVQQQEPDITNYEKRQP
jgi:hypothetical protein